MVDQPSPIDALLKGCIGESPQVSGRRSSRRAANVAAPTPRHQGAPQRRGGNGVLCRSGDFLQTLQDEDINVRRAALVMFNSAARNKPSLIRGLLATVLPHLYGETRIRKELIREVRI